MAIPTKENTGLELRKNEKGRLELWHRGEKIPATEINYRTRPMERGTVTVELLAQHIQVVDE